MSTGTMITVIVAAVAVIALALLLGAARRRRGSVRGRFGPEYHRTVGQHGGDTEAAERELRERLRRHGKLRLQPLTAQERTYYAARWTAVRERFVDAPGEAVTEADRLLARLAEARGFPGDGYDERVAALSVHHPRHVRGYRETHAIAVSGRAGEVGTEELRRALVHARELYEDLTAEGTDHGDRHGRGERDGGGLAGRLRTPRRHHTSGGST